MTIADYMFPDKSWLAARRALEVRNQATEDGGHESEDRWQEAAVSARH